VATLFFLKKFEGFKKIKIVGVVEGQMGGGLATPKAKINYFFFFPILSLGVAEPPL
jgi:hypothetical protein